MKYITVFDITDFKSFNIFFATGQGVCFAKWRTNPIVIICFLCKTRKDVCLRAFVRVLFFRFLSLYIKANVWPFITHFII